MRVSTALGVVASVAVFAIASVSVSVASVGVGRVRGVTAHAGTQKVKVSWRAVSGASRYQLRLRRGTTEWSAPRRAGQHRAYTVKHLANGTHYSFSVRACRNATCGSWSRPAAATPHKSTVWPLGRGTAGCKIMPTDNVWHQDISTLPVDSMSISYINSIGSDGHLHPDFGSPREYGIPYATVPASQHKVAIHFTAYGDESDAGPYPTPFRAPVEGGPTAGGDRHVLVLQGTPTCKLYELYHAFQRADGSWNADSGAVYDLSSNALRPDGWTSADAAGLPILPGLIRYDEIVAGHIDHAIRMTVNNTQAGYIHPATHFASTDTSASLPPMGLRMRLKSSFDMSAYPAGAQVILQAMKTYGMIVADNGTDWYFGGATDSRWNDDQLNMLKQVPGSAFEVVHTGSIHR